MVGCLTDKNPYFMEGFFSVHAAEFLLQSVFVLEFGLTKLILM